MPSLLPFQGLRPNPAITGPLSLVVCPPYDVVDDQDRERLAAKSPYNFVRVEVPAGDYAAAAALLAQWRAMRALVQDAVPALYGYRMTYRTPGGPQRETVGVIGALPLQPPGREILPHEQTTPKDKTDRLELIRATRSNTSPIWCLCPETGLANLVSLDDQTKSLATAVDGDSVVHELWPVTDPKAHRAVAELTGARPLLVADGHHRYETALAYQAEVGTRRPIYEGPAGAGRQQSGPNGPAGRGGHAGTDRDDPKDRRSAGQWEAAPASFAAAELSADALGPDAVLCLVVELSPKYLHVRAIHRAISGIAPGTDLLAELSKTLSLTPARSAGPGLLDEMEAAGAAGALTPAGAFLARPLPGKDAVTKNPDVPMFDSALIDAALARLPSHQLRYEHDPARAFIELSEGKLDAVFLCRAPTVAQIAATARGGERMPPKTTFFWPKPRSGMVLRAW